MAGYLEQYGAGDERRAKITKIAVLAIVVLLMAGGIVYLFFHNYPEEREASPASASTGGAEAMTSRAVEPFCRASTKLPSTVRVRTIFIAAGFAASTSLTVVLAR